MPDVFGFSTNASAQPVEYVEGEEGDFGQPSAPGEWRPVGEAVPVVLLPMRSEEKQRAGIETDLEARKLFYSLGSGEITTRGTLAITGAGYGGERFDVRSVSPYDVPGFPAVGLAEVVRL